VSTFREQLVKFFHRRKEAAIERFQAKRREQQQDAEFDLLIDDAQFQGLSREALFDLVQKKADKEESYPSIGDWPEGY
jgi:hypothetical protein